MLFSTLKPYKREMKHYISKGRGIMKNLKERIAEVSGYLQNLMDPVVFSDVQNAVENKDKDLLVEVCRKVKIPEIYMSLIVSILLAIEPLQPKWPYPEY